MHDIVAASSDKRLMSDKIRTHYNTYSINLNLQKKRTYEIQSHQQCFTILIKVSVNSAMKKQVLNFISEYNSATRKQTYLISMTENKLVNYLITFCIHFSIIACCPYLTCSSVCNYSHILYVLVTQCFLPICIKNHSCI
jgi:hypothetical protein